ncbi:hypothetical protein CCMSSC00406_0000906 [Pleurotus cornucopiae]|uniref:Uncharacterized protein n=1 Tax=Pleurotus cornucopiae TaxID=5321 RepID=A0ACB7JC21_PLECO|nr:hypothetical protein CCMSSC00406_0000906 [Pleurotus cornucopiae]
MSEIYAPVQDFPKIPDNLTVPQFLLDVNHPTRPQPPSVGTPWLIDDTSGATFGKEEVRCRIDQHTAQFIVDKIQYSMQAIAMSFSSSAGTIVVGIVRLTFPNATADKYWAVHRIGGVISGANPDFTVDELAYQLEATKATFMFVYSDAQAVGTAVAAARRVNIPLSRVVLFGAASELSPESATVDELARQGLLSRETFVERRLAPGEGKTKLAFLSFSSGTTGKPKVVMRLSDMQIHRLTAFQAVAIPHFSLIANVIQLAVHNRINEAYTTWEERRFRPSDVCIGVLPFYHIYGLVINLHFILFASMSIVVIPRFNFVGMLNSIAKHRVTHLMLVPPQVVLLCKHPAMATADVSSVRFIMVGAAPLTYEVTEQLIRIFPNAHIGQAYGMTETCTATTMWPIEHKRGAFGSGGQLMPGIVARVEKQDGTLAGFDEPGHLVIKTPSVTLGYADNEEATKETFVDGWVRTGDEVRIDSNKEVWVLDRLKEIMKVRGFQVAPAELEGCLLDHPDVSDACVVGIPDDFSGEVPMAFVVPAPDSAKRMQNDKKVAGQIKTSIIQHVADNKVKYKHLAGGVEFIDIIPKNPSGKLLRRVLRDKAKHLQKSRALAKL